MPGEVVTSRHTSPTSFKNLRVAFRGLCKYEKAVECFHAATKVNAAYGRLLGHLEELVKEHPELYKTIPTPGRFLTVAGARWRMSVNTGPVSMMKSSPLPEVYMSISKKTIIENPLKEYNQFISKLTRQQIEDLSDEEILKLAIERPGHPGQYGFMLQPQYFRSDKHLAETMKALLDRLAKAKK